MPSEARSKNAGESATAPGPIWPAVTASFVVALGVLSVPAAAPDLGIDSSWCAVLAWAHQAGLRFGHDVVFTYGPLGYLLAPYCVVPPKETLILFNAALCFHVSLGLCLLSWRLKVFWRVLLLGIFIFESSNAQVKADLILETGLFCWGLLCLVEAGQRRSFCAAGFALLAGLSGLIKVMYLFTGAFSVVALVLSLSLSGDWKTSYRLMGGFAAVLLFCWLACGQPLADFGSFVINGIVVSREYGEAAGLGGLPMLRWLGVLLGLITLGAVVLQVWCAGESGARFRGWQRLLVLGWVSGLLLLVWKHGLVRLDRQHFFDLSGFAVVSALGLHALPSNQSRFRLAARAISLVCCLLSVLIVHWAFLPAWLPSLTQITNQWVWNSGWLFCPEKNHRLQEPGLLALRQEAQLPGLRSIIRGASVDVFGCHQAHAVLNGLNYHPRPVFQSYLAYNRKLAKLNEAFYLSDRAPEFVLLELAGLEHRYSALDDSLALRTVLANYDAVSAEKDFVLVRHKATSRPTQLKSIKTRAFTIGERLDLDAESADNLWLELEIEPTWYGRLMEFIYRAPPIRLSVWDGPKRVARRQAAPPVLSSGFLCSPFLSNSEDIQNFYGNKPVLRPTGFSLEPDPGTAWFWQPTVRFRLFRVITDANER